MQDTFFIRHNSKLGLDKTTLDSMWQAGRIGIHYPHVKGVLEAADNESLNLDTYSGRGHSVVKTLLGLAQRGGYVCAQYRDHNDILVGVVEPETAVQLLKGVWVDSYGMPGRIAVMKTLQLQRIQRLPLSECTQLLVGRPRQGTLMRWPSIGHVIGNLIEGRTAKLSISALVPCQQEILCSEFLRVRHAGMPNLPALAHLLLPVGKTMKDIDIYALANDGKRICAQVTHKAFESCKDKSSALKQYASPKNHLVLFCKTNQYEHLDGMHIVPIEVAFDYFQLNEAGRQWLSAVFNVN
jgi:hypothetical protein